ncbi:hypothetical protein GCM10018790_41430 [Kitasatospora xanthocidica]|nr:hypothetical protein GCM10018790_41430 [Kitasatospora xanthocidica]
MPAEPRSLLRELSSRSRSGAAANLKPHGSSASTRTTAESTSSPAKDAALTCSFHPCAGRGEDADGLAVHQKPPTVTSQPPRPPRSPAPASAARVVSGHGPAAAAPRSTDPLSPAVRSDVPAPIRHHIPSSWPPPAGAHCSGTRACGPA